jgi:3-oxoadipate enol-lactonase
MAFARIKGRLVHWREQGPRAAPCVVLVNSLGTDLRIWDEVASALSSDWRVIVYDKRGHGLSDVPPGPYSIAELSDDLLALVDHLGIERFALVGLSIGGMIGQDLAARVPQRLSALVLADTAPKIGAPESWNERIRIIERGGLGELADSVMERWFTPGFRTAQPDQVSGWRNAFVNLPADGYIATCEALREADLTDRIGQISAPTLVVVGELDLATSPELVAAMAQGISGARFELIGDCGHIPPIEQPERLLKLVAEHLKEHCHA